VDALVGTVQDLRHEGVSIVWIEHIVHALLSVVDRLLALAEGRKLIEGAPQEVMSSAALRDVYLGREL
jgi:branched-chain amino acid transport system ATP-binding protein